MQAPQHAAGKDTSRADQLKLRSQRSHQQPTLPDKASRAALKRSTATKASKRRPEPEEEDVSDGDPLPVRARPAAMQSQATAASVQHTQAEAEVETFVYVNTTADVGSRLNQATPGKRKSRPKGQPCKGIPPEDA